MKNRWIILIIALLSLSMVLASCGKDPLVDNPDTDIHTDDPAASTPEDTTVPEDTTAPEETTAPAEEIEIPTLWADYADFMDFALDSLGFSPFSFDGEFDTIVEGEYYSVFYENANPEGYMDPHGGCITMVLSPGGGLARIYVEYASDIDPFYVCNAAISPFDDDDDETRQMMYAIEDFINEAMKPEAPAQSQMEYGDVVVYLSKGFDDILPLYFCVEAKGVTEFMANHPIEQPTE